MKKGVLLAALSILCLQLLHAQPGRLDSSFGNNGIVKADFGPNTTLTTTVVQNDGKILMTGYTHIENGETHSFLARYNADGSLDNSFNSSGKIWLQNSAKPCVQADGKIIVTSNTIITRYNADGSLDHSFGKDGIQENDFAVSSTIIQRDGKIVVGGAVIVPNYDLWDYSYYNIARYNPNGSIDTSFSGDGKQTAEFIDGESDWPEYLSNFSLAIQSDGKIVMSCSELTGDWFSYGGWMVRYNIDGNIDKKESIWIDELSQVSSMAIGSNDKIVMTGNIFNHAKQAVVLRIVGTDDWSRYGWREVSLPYDDYKVYLEDDGKIIMLGRIIARLNAGGSLDSTFGNKGILEINGVSDISISNNKMYVTGGGYSGSVARYLLDNNNNGEATPVVTLTSPTNNTVRLAPAAHIKLSATASDADGTIAKVEFYNGTKLLH